MVITLSQTIPACKRLLMHSRLIFQLPFMPFVPSVLAPSSPYHSHKWWEASGQCLVLIHTNTKDTHSRDTYMLGQAECGPLPLLCPWSCHCCVPGSATAVSLVLPLLCPWSCQLLCPWSHQLLCPWSRPLQVCTTPQCTLTSHHREYFSPTTVSLQSLLPLLPARLVTHWHTSPQLPCPSPCAPYH